MAAVHLTGNPSHSYDHDDYKNDQRQLNKLFELMDDADDKNYSIMSCSPGQGEADLGTGIAAGHAYSVVEIWKVDTNRGMERLLKIRNPWGRVEWKGDWSDNSSLWTPQLRAQCGSVVGNDGFFFMRFEDYITNFRSTDICVDNNSAAVHNRVKANMTS